MKFIKYKIELIEPLRLIDKSRSASNQGVTLGYISGGAIRGAVVNNLESNDKRKQVLENVNFWNGYPVVQGEETLPSPKGFYENKEENDLKSIYTSKDTERTGMKRAKLGQFVQIRENCIDFTSVKKGEVLQIDVNKSSLFRMEYIEKNQVFQGYISSDNEELLEIISDVLKKDNLYIGSDRSAGYGYIRCQVEAVEQPYQQYMANKNLEKEAYLYLLSDTAMYDKYGNLTGIDLEMLEKKLGVQNLTIKDCSTSVIKKSGYNRTYGCATSVVPLYEKGSTFSLEFDGIMAAEKIQNICATGIGIQKEEGCGSILILEKWIDVTEKKKVSIDKVEEQEEKAKDCEIRYFAKALYEQKMKRNIEEYIVTLSDKLPASKHKNQVGRLWEIYMQNRYNPEKGLKEIQLELMNQVMKSKSQNKHIETASTRTEVRTQLSEHILSIMNEDLTNILQLHQNNRNEEASIMGIPVAELFEKEEEQQYRYELIGKIIKYYIRQGESKKKEE